MRDLALASQNSPIICGMKRFSAVNVFLCGRRYAQNTLKLFAIDPLGAIAQYERTLHDGWNVRLTVVDGIGKLKNMYELGHERDKTDLEIFNILWFRTAAENHATDSKDLVYLLLALLPKALVENLEVDFSESNTYLRVMSDFAAAHIKTYNFTPPNSVPALAFFLPLRRLTILGAQPRSSI